MSAITSQQRHTLRTRKPQHSPIVRGIRVRHVALLLMIAAAAAWGAAASAQIEGSSPQPIAGETASISIRDQLLQELRAGSLTSEAARGMYASYAARGSVPTDRRWWLLTPDESPHRPLRTSESKPLDPVRQLPPAWREQYGSQDAASPASLVVPTQFRRIRGAARPVVLRRGAMLESETFLFETDSSADSWPAIVETCETTAAVLRSLLELPEIPRGRMRIVVAKARNEYLRLLGGQQRRLAISSGYYNPTANTVYCYWDGRPDTVAALRHEVTHQVLTNAWAGAVDAKWRSRPGFWAYEAIAAYAESIRIVGGVGETLVAAGGWDAPRLQAARYRRLHDLQWIDWQSLRALDADDFQSPADIQLRYSQSAGLAHMFLDAPPDAGGDAAGFVSLLEAVHRGSGAAEFAMVDDEDLRRNYDGYLRIAEDSVEDYSLLPPRSDIVLSRCDVSGGSLARWPASHRRLDWLDLSFTDAGGSWLSAGDLGAWSIRRLNLESNPLDPTALESLVSVTAIEELDVSDCGLGDDAIRMLLRLPKLKRLWLTGNPVTDEILPDLAAARQLEHVDVQRTQITSQAWQTFIRSNPRLR